MTSRLIVTMLILYIVPVALNLMTRQAESDSAESIYDFKIMPTKGISFLGVVVAGTAVLFMVVAVLVNQFRGFAAITFFVMALFGIMMILAPVEGCWETSVQGDDITVSRFWVVRKRAKVSDIEYCRQGKGSIHVYLKDGKRALSIDNLCTNVSAFRKRMAEEGVKIDPYQQSKM